MSEPYYLSETTHFSHCVLCCFCLVHSSLPSLLLLGLGKTLQSIALAWTLLNSNPSPTAGRKGVVSKVLIVCPATLVNNWQKEFSKCKPHTLTFGLVVAKRKQLAAVVYSLLHCMLVLVL